jgi:hypothetical protein
VDRESRRTTVTSNGNYEQFSDRAVPFAGDYLWVTSLGNVAFGAWTDWRDTVAGSDPREAVGRRQRFRRRTSVPHVRLVDRHVERRHVFPATAASTRISTEPSVP